MAVGSSDISRVFRIEGLRGMKAFRTKVVKGTSTRERPTLRATLSNALIAADGSSPTKSCLLSKTT